VTGLALLHLQCHIGTDTLSWARHGARVVGLDFSDPAVAVAGELARECGLDVEFVCVNVYDAVEVLGGRHFDIVYTGIGALNWLPDLGQWARVVAELVRPGGVVFLVEIHPMVSAVALDGRTLCQDVFDAAYSRWEATDGTCRSGSRDGQHDQLRTGALAERGHLVPARRWPATRAVP
jgi:2-polyprenyl-3-methyl-5-hydroxy-6-metoxy-1,4-benzoquinol methylase